MKKIITLLFTAMISLSASAICDSCLIAYYPFNSNANDASGHGNNGTVSNATLTTDRFGNANSAYSFNGTTSYISLGNAASLKKYNSDFTVAAWINATSFSSSYQSLVVSNRGNTGQGSAFGLLGSSNGTNIGKTASIISGGGTSSQIISSTALSTGTWYHIVLTFKYNGSNNNDVKLYINGVLQASTTQKNITDPGSLATYIGFEPSPSSPSSYHFNGKIDDVRLYSCALSQAQITNMYSSENSNLVAYYPFCGNANDASGHGYNGVVHNATLTSDRFNRANSAYSFNGSTSFISLGNNAALKKYNSDFSISAWINPTATTSDYQSIIVSNRGPAGEGSAFALLGASIGTDEGKITSIVNGGFGSSYVTGNQVLSPGNWYLVTLTFKYNGGDTNRVKLYVNGILKANATQKNITNPDTLSTYIGFEPSPSSPGTYHFNGKIDDVRIYNSVLSDGFVANLNDVNDNIFRISSQTDTEYSSGISVFPNPANDIVHIQSEGLQKITLLTIDGKTIYTKHTNDPEIILELNDFKKGSYVLIIETTFETKKQKLIIY